MAKHNCVYKCVLLNSRSSVKVEGSTSMAVICSEWKESYCFYLPGGRNLPSLLEMRLLQATKHVRPTYTTRKHIEIGAYLLFESSVYLKLNIKMKFLGCLNVKFRQVSSHVGIFITKRHSAGRWCPFCD